MINYFKTEKGQLVELPEFEKNCWVSVQEPSPEEIDYIENQLSIDPKFIEASLDSGEKSHIEKKNGQYFIVFDLPIETPNDAHNIPEFFMLPVGFVFAESCVVSITSKKTKLMEEIHDGALEDADASDPMNLVLSVVYHLSSHFVMHLDSIDDIVFNVGIEMKNSTNNKELIKVLSLQKSLVYFSASLKSTEATLKKIRRQATLTITEEEKGTIDDILIEIQQSIENAQIYTEVLASTIDAISSMMSNNLNAFMKIMTSATIVLSIPNMIFGFYGMNVTFHINEISVIVPIVSTVLIVIITVYALYKKDFFN